jgi:hypothetical protein
MLPKTFSVSSKLTLLLASLLLLSNCAKPEPNVVVQTEYVERTIPLQAHPKSVQLNDVKWYVVTEDNLPQFLEQFKKDNGVVAFMAVSVQGYENLSMNVQELRRYILQQKSVIVYYEQAIQSPDPAQ